MRLRRPALRALIYLRDYACFQHLDEHCVRQRYRVVGVQGDPDGSRWVRFVEALLAGEYDVIVRCPDLDKDRVPRVDLVPHPEAPDVVSTTVADAVEVRPLYQRPRRRW